jgi:hypothetical protein
VLEGVWIVCFWQHRAAIGPLLASFCRLVGNVGTTTLRCVHTYPGVDTKRLIQYTQACQDESGKAGHG